MDAAHTAVDVSVTFATDDYQSEFQVERLANGSETTRYAPYQAAHWRADQLQVTECDLVPDPAGTDRPLGTAITHTNAIRRTAQLARQLDRPVHRVARVCAMWRCTLAYVWRGACQLPPRRRQDGFLERAPVRINYRTNIDDSVAPPEGKAENGLKY